jgi:cysteine-rich repeat protein
MKRTLLLTLGALWATATFARAQCPTESLLSFGPVSPAHVFPGYYIDSMGLALQPCLDRNGACVIEGADLTEPIVFPGNFPPEPLYWLAEAELADAGGERFRLGLSVAGTFVNGAIVLGEEFTEAAIGIRGEGLPVGATYAFTHPYGVEELTSDEDGRIRFEDAFAFQPEPPLTIGLLAFAGPVAPPARVGPFLVWDTSPPAPPGGFIGHPAVPHAITGSPCGTNFFKVTGAGLPGAGLRTDFFSVMGQTIETCGNDFLDPFEECDDGNREDGDCCSSMCQFEDSGSPCSDGDACTLTDSCNATGECLGTNDVVCTPLDQCHVVGVCHPATGVCSNPNQTDGTGCDDIDLCTQTDRCQNGNCVGANGVVCTALDQCHIAGVCNPGTGMCSNPEKVSGFGCDDGNACTEGDTCSGGECMPGTPVVCTALDQCHVAGTCNSLTGCSNPKKDDGLTCSDGSLCTQSDTCQNGICVGANAVVCAAQDDCHLVGVCVPGTGVCTNPNKENGSGCSDNNLCTQTDTCQNGLCVGANAVVCTPLDQCHLAGVCNTGTGVCTNPNKENGSGCSDGNLCTQTDTCQGGICTGANAVVCTAQDDCHLVGVCVPGTGVCTNPIKDNGSGCSDGNLCTQTDTCQSGLCVGANAVVCTALDQCHVAGVCNTGTGVCTNPNKGNGSSCSDGNLCTQTDTCQGGICVGANAVVCTALDQCHVVGVCNTGTGLCSNPNKLDGVFCTDDNTCTTGDHCQSGACVTGGTLLRCCGNGTKEGSEKCDDGNQVGGDCCSASCQLEPAGTPCDDDNGCTSSDVCGRQGLCIGSAVVCQAAGPCRQQGACDPDTGVCAPNSPVNDGTSCTDGNACTGPDTCQGGACQGSCQVSQSCGKRRGQTLRCALDGANCICALP